jgi:hypothetical protein
LRYASFDDLMEQHRRRRAGRLFTGARYRTRHIMQRMSHTDVMISSYRRDGNDVTSMSARHS